MQTVKRAAFFRLHRSQVIGALALGWLLALGCSSSDGSGPPAGMGGTAGSEHSGGSTAHAGTVNHAGNGGHSGAGGSESVTSGRGGNSIGGTADNGGESTGEAGARPAAGHAGAAGTRAVAGGAGRGGTPGVGGDSSAAGGMNEAGGGEGGEPSNASGAAPGSGGGSSGAAGSSSVLGTGGVAGSGDSSVAGSVGLSVAGSGGSFETAGTAGTGWGAAAGGTGTAGSAANGGASCAVNHGGCDSLTACTDGSMGPMCGDCPAGYDGTGTSGCTPRVCSGAPDATCACVRVAPNGNDTLGGATGGVTPFQTLQAAIDFAAQHRSHATTVCVATGADCSSPATYSSTSGADLVMRDGISVYGNYESTGWSRCTDYDYGPRTSLVTSGPNGVYFGRDISSRTVLDGFGLSAPGVRVEEARSVQLSQLFVDQASGWPSDHPAVQATGNVDGLSIADSYFRLAGAGAITGIGLEACAGAVNVADNNVQVTATALSGSPGSALALGVDGSCTALVTGNSFVSAGGDGVDNTSVACSAPCTLRDNPEILVEKSGSVYLPPQTIPARGNVTVLSCVGCAELSHNTITSSLPVGTYYDQQNGYSVTGAFVRDTPLVARNDIESGCADHAVALDAANGRLENNVIVAGCIPNRVGGDLSFTQYGVALLAGPNLDVNSNAIVSRAPYTSGPPTAQSESAGISGTLPTKLRDNVIGARRAALGLEDGMFLALVQGPNASSYAIDHNNLLEPIFSYGNDLTTNTTAHDLLTSSANFFDDCFETSDFHLVKGSPCVDRGNPSGAPVDDRDGEPRDASPDVGPDEWSAAHDPCTSITCSGHGTCLPVLFPSGLRCSCDAGYVQAVNDSTACIADVCTTTCDPNALCYQNQDASFTCGPCRPGFSGTPSTGCMDIDECATDNGGCDPRVVCTNTPGSRTCGDCPSGYSGSGYGTCTTEACPAGYTGDVATGCVDIDECASSSVCDPLTTCTNLPGSFSCSACPPGYDGSGSSGCYVDLCAGFSCEHDGTCVSDAGGAACICPPGITGKNCELSATKISAEDGLAALYGDGSIHAWGFEASSGTTITFPDSYIDVAVGHSYACALDTSGHVQCSGHYLSNPPTDVFATITANFDHRCGIHPDGTLACWGYDDVGQADPPSGTFSAVVTGGAHSCGITTSGTIVCWGAPQPSSGQEVAPPGIFTAIAANSATNCAIRNDGSIVCWGYDFTQGVPPPTGSFQALAISEYYGCAIRDDGRLACWGTLAANREAPPDGEFKAVATGTSSACALRNDDVIACWGQDQANLDGLRNPPDGDFTELSKPCALVDCGDGTCSLTDDLHCTCPDQDVHHTDDVLTCVPNPCWSGGCDPLTRCVVTDDGRVCTACPTGYTGTGETGCVPAP